MKESIKELNKAKMQVELAIRQETFTIPIIGKASDLHTTPEDSGFDLRYNGTTDLVIKPFETVVIPTGIRLGMFRIDDYQQYEAQVRPRSSISRKGLLVHLGTVDWGYRGEIGVIVTNLNKEPFIVTPRMRVAQLVFVIIAKPELLEVEALDNTKRGSNGFGSTGI